MSTSGELVGHRDLVSGFSFSHHAGQSHICVSSSSDGSLRFWDAAVRSLIREYAAHQVGVTSLSITSLKHFYLHFSICCSLNVKITNLALTGSGEVFSPQVSDALLPCVQTAITAVHWSPVDCNLVVSGDEKGVVVCHWYHTGDTASCFPEPRSIFCLSCSPHTWSTVAVG